MAEIKTALVVICHLGAGQMAFIKWKRSSAMWRYRQRVEHLHLAEEIGDSREGDEESIARKDL